MENTMNMTMGKRIFYYRKRMGLTQEQLADKVGVTAQAVSKWEHDLSCPDVTLLPRLAEVFGVSGDELLGLRNAPVEEAKEGIVEEQKERKPWTWSWTGFEVKILGSVYLLCLGGLFLASELLQWGVTFWEIFWPLSVMFLGLSGCKGYCVFGAVCTGAGLYFLLVNLKAIPAIVTWPIAVGIFIILCGVGLLLRRLGKKSRRNFINGNVEFNSGKRGSRENPIRDCHWEEGALRAEYAFCSDRITVNEEIFRGGKLEVAFGSLVLDLQGCADVSEGCTLHLDIAFSSTVLLVPRHLKVVEGGLSKAGNATNVVGTPEPGAKPIFLTGDAGFGALKIQYI